MNTREIFKYWLMYYVPAVTGAFLIGAISGMIVGAIIAYPMSQQHADVNAIQKAVTVPMWIAFYAFAPFWSFFCFRWVILKIIRHIREGER